MSNLVSLLGFDGKSHGAAEDWAFNNGDDHIAIRDAAQRLGFGNLTVWQLWPVDWKDQASYELRHQSAHNEMNAALGLAGSDLTGVDLTDPAKSASWHQQHFSEHQAARAKLGI
jgi:hypothetical protein